MQFLVDGQNAIHALRMKGRDIAALRAALVARVRRHAPRGAHVHFDGHPPAGAFARTDDGGVEVQFSGDREADDAIAEIVRESRTPSRFVVVTDDLELARRVEQMGAQSARVAEFFAAEDEPEGAGDAKSAPAGSTAADFGLPEIVDTDAPAEPPRHARTGRLIRLRPDNSRRGRIPPR
jgi:hypothetical protein